MLKVGLVRRSWSFFIDLMLHSFLAGLATILFTFLTYPEHITYSDSMRLFIVLFIILFSIINSKSLAQNGQSIGKYLTGIKIVKVNGKKTNLFELLIIRKVLFFLFILIPYGWFILLIDIILVFDINKRCLHDYLVGTHVINVEDKTREKEDMIEDKRRDIAE